VLTALSVSEIDFMFFNTSFIFVAMLVPV